MMMATAFALVATVVSQAANTTAPAPNILIMFTDDQGWGDNEYNCENSTAMCARTPNLAAFAKDDHTALFHRFYSASSVCSPTRATILTGRSNNRDCISFALPCCNEDPAPTCSQGAHGGLPWPEFTIAKAAKKSKLGDYATIQLGKWHLGDLWDKKLPGMSPEKWSVSSPGDHGFDEWLTTQAEASNSMPNCGCFPVNHTNPGPKPPSGYPDITPHGDQCVVGGGVLSDWAYPCTQYYFPNASDPRQVSDSVRVPGDDSTWLVDHFESFLTKRVADKRPWLAHICFHAIHEPHPSMPEFYHQYANDPDYLGALTMWDAQVGRLLTLLKTQNVASNTAIFYTT
jgi:arylsulfatase A-like enzyme